MAKTKIINGKRFQKSQTRFETKAEAEKMVAKAKKAGQVLDVRIVPAEGYEVYARVADQK